MQIPFYKYQGTGNDFILIDNRSQTVSLSTEQVAHWCHRKWGIGADGLMLLEQAPGYDFKMVYYNADGNESTMCGNGGRCIAAFAHRLGLVTNHARFLAIDGPHEATLAANGTVSLQMIDVADITFGDQYAILNTGSPHYVSWVTDVDRLGVVEAGRAIRNRTAFQPKGINVNFAERRPDALRVRTYERGVEDETLSCGTGVTAVAIASAGQQTGSFHIPIQTPGGALSVSFEKNNATTATGVVLSGAATFVFEGVIRL